MICVDSMIYVHAIYLYTVYMHYQHVYMNVYMMSIYVVFIYIYTYRYTSYIYIYIIYMIHIYIYTRYYTILHNRLYVIRDTTGMHSLKKTYVLYQQNCRHLPAALWVSSLPALSPLIVVHLDGFFQGKKARFKPLVTGQQNGYKCGYYSIKKLL